ncbi:hypothetical protein FQN54_009857 [Arachnomyces sp. PD_36]|nr:hypothetical protein FQN54_009857 [Arachnomyces sp. PD_36]
MSQQDPVYQRPDVPLDRGTQEAWAETWGKPKLIGADGNSPVTCETSEGSPLIDHCIPSLDFLLDYPDDPIPNGLKEHTFWTAYQHSCAVSVFYKEDWDESCDVTLGDIAAAAYPIFTQCSDDALGKVGGVRKFGEGKCAGFLQIIHTHGLPPNPT